MPQYARPDSDIAVGLWITAPLCSKINEVTPNDTDYISQDDAGGSTCRLGLSDVTDPNIHTGHVVRHRAKKSGGYDIDYIVALYQGTTLIASWNRASSLTESYQTFTEALSEAQAGNITDYTALELRFTGNLYITTYPSVSWAEFECPVFVQELADSLTFSDEIEKLFGKEVAESVSVSDLLEMMTQIAKDEDITLSDAIEACLIFFHELADSLTISDAIELLSGKEFAEGVTLADVIEVLAQLTKDETMTLTDAVEFLVDIAKEESITLTDVIVQLVQTTKAETMTLTDLVAPYAFKLNVPLPSYKPKLLIEMMLDSGTKRIAAEDLYIEE